MTGENNSRRVSSEPEVTREAIDLSGPILQVRGLTVCYRHEGTEFPVLRDVTFDVQRGRTVGIVGESGSGKSTLSLVLMGLAERIGASVSDGQILWDGRDILRMSAREVESLRRSEFGLIVQDPHSSLDPAFTIRNQMLETVEESTSREDRLSKVLDALARVRLPDPDGTSRKYPHQLSGGMKQRVVGAMAIVNSPQLLIADEPTTALDVTIQAQYLNLLAMLSSSLGLTMVFISHDLNVIAQVCDDVIVMYAGRIVEQAPVERLFDAPKHPYTQGLLASRLDGRLVGRSERLHQIAGQPPQLWDPPVGCSFAPRCSQAEDLCLLSPGPLSEVEPHHLVECRVAVTGRGGRRGSDQGEVSNV